MPAPDSKLLTPRNALIAAFVFAAAVGSVMTLNALRQRDANRADEASSFMADEETADWTVFSDPDSGFSFKYPSSGFFDPGADPEVIVGDCNASVFPKECPNIDELVVQGGTADGGDEEAVRSNLDAVPDWRRPTKLATADGTHYCLTSMGDAAMSHTYEIRYYTTVRDQKCVVAVLKLSRTNCDAYLPLEEGNQVQKDSYDACITKNAEQPRLIKQVFRTFRLGE